LSLSIGVSTGRGTARGHDAFVQNSDRAAPSRAGSAITPTKHTPGRAFSRTITRRTQAGRFDVRQQPADLPVRSLFEAPTVALFAEAARKAVQGG
jgi:hypothetical protein